MTSNNKVSIVIFFIFVALLILGCYWQDAHESLSAQNSPVTKTENKENKDVSQQEKGLFANYIVWAVPIFILLIIFEYFVARWQRKELYRLNDSISDLSCGITEQVSALLKTALFGAYTLVYEFCRVNDWHIFYIPNNLYAWILAFIVVDFFYYWAHRLSHTTAIGWAGHCVHHQSEEFNFAVAIRQGAFQSLFNFWFYLPMAVMGFHPIVYAATKSFNTIYQFWVHTKLVNKMGFVENFMNTPSHHRVHHGRNEKYLDKNYAGVFIVWDYLFRTFEPEQEEVAYGVTTPLNTWNPVTANLQFLWFLAKLSYQAPHFIDKVKVWFMPPGWLPRGVTITEKSYPLFYKYNPVVSKGLSFYALVQFLITATVTMFLFAYEQKLGNEKYILACFVMFSLISIATIFDQRKSAIFIEMIRLIAIGIYLLGFVIDYQNSTSLFVCILLILIFFGIWLEHLKKDRKVCKDGHQ